MNLSSPPQPPTGPSLPLPAEPTRHADQLPPDDTPPGRVVPLVDDHLVPGPEPMWLCAKCDHPIAKVSDAIEMLGASVHTRVNPHGDVFRIGCFSEAPGARGEGPHTGHWTWFPGYEWQAAICAVCTEHLGWRFSSGQVGFYGLILDRLRAQTGGNAA